MTFKINSQGHTAMHQTHEGYILLIILLKGVEISTNNYKEQTVIMTFLDKNQGHSVHRYYYVYLGNKN